MSVKYKTDEIRITYDSWESVEERVKALKLKGATNFSFGSSSEWESNYAFLEYQIPMTQAEIAAEEARLLKHQQDSLAWKRKQFEALKKELGE